MKPNHEEILLNAKRCAKNPEDVPMIERKMKLGMELQRKGKSREYGELMKEIEEMEKR